MTRVILTASPEEANAPSCPVCGCRPLPIPSQPALCPVCLSRAIYDDWRPGEPLPFPDRFPVTSETLITARRVLITAAIHAGLEVQEAERLVLNRLPSRRRFCDAHCRRMYHADADADRQHLDPRSGHCWCCGLPLESDVPDEHYLLVHARASPSYHYGTSYTVLKVGDLQIVAVEADDVEEVWERFFAGLHLAARETFATIAEAYEAAQADLTRRCYHRPDGAASVELTPFTEGITVQAHTYDRGSDLVMEVQIDTLDPHDPSWYLRTSVAYVREVDRALRGLGVRYATLIGAQLWLELGLPTPTRQP